jgi:hypothetical protein
VGVKGGGDETRLFFGHRLQQVLPPRIGFSFQDARDWPDLLSSRRRDGEGVWTDGLASGSAHPAVPPGPPSVANS